MYTCDILLKHAKYVGYVIQSAEKSNIRATRYGSSNSIQVSGDDVMTWIRGFEGADWLTVQPSQLCHTKLIPNDAVTDPRSPSPTYTASDFKTIYSFPDPDPEKDVVIGVISFGGGLHGNTTRNINDDVDILTSGDVFTYWGAPMDSVPTVAICLVDTAKNNPGDFNATAENTLDVETIGACYKSSRLTIILYIAPNSTTGMVNVFNRAINTSVKVKGVSVKPQYISVSWGAPETAFTMPTLLSLDALFSTAASNGVNICVASGDNGSSDGVPGKTSVCDFPSSSPSVIACGGTNLFCPAKRYDESTVERAWSLGGGAISSVFAKPAYQSMLSGSKRNTPDVAMNADPATGVSFLVKGVNYVFGGTSIVAPAMTAYLACTGLNKFANPKLYKTQKQGFYDIKQGSNGLYTAVLGYDNCTGWGSVNGSILTPLLLSDTDTVPPPAKMFAIINKKQITLVVGETFISVCSVTPSESIVAWSSDLGNVASVDDKSGIVTALQPGTAKITGSFDGLSDFYFVTVVPKVVAVTSVVVSPVRVALKAGQTQRLTVQVLPVDASNKTVVWKSSNTRVASVNNDGLVTASAAGRCVVSASSASGSKVGSCTVTVSAAVLPTYLRIRITAPPTTVLRKNQTVQLKAVLLPSNVTNSDVKWTTNSAATAFVSASGLVTARTAGSVTITVTADANKNLSDRVLFRVI